MGRYTLQSASLCRWPSRHVQMISFSQGSKPWKLATPGDFRFPVFLHGFFFAKRWSIQSEVESKQRNPFAVANGCSYCRSLQIPHGSKHIATCTSMINFLNVSHTSNPASDALILVETWILRTDRKAIFSNGIEPYSNLHSSYYLGSYPCEGLQML